MTVQERVWYVGGSQKGPAGLRNGHRCVRGMDTVALMFGGLVWEWRYSGDGTGYGGSTMEVF